MKVINGFPDYAVGEDGSIWRIIAPISGSGCAKALPYEIKPSRKQGKWGYKRVQLWKDGKEFSKLVHRLVLEAFVGPCPKWCQGAHNDGNPENNILSNLRWVTAKNNQKDRLAHGTAMYGEAHHKAKLSSLDVEQIRASKVSSRVLGKQYGVTHTQILYIRSGKSWATNSAQGT